MRAFRNMRYEYSDAGDCMHLQSKTLPQSAFLATMLYRAAVYKSRPHIPQQHRHMQTVPQKWPRLDIMAEPFVICGRDVGSFSPASPHHAPSDPSLTTTITTHRHTNKQAAAEEQQSILIQRPYQERKNGGRESTPHEH